MHEVVVPPAHQDLGFSGHTGMDGVAAQEVAEHVVVGTGREAADRILFLDGGLIVEEGTPDQIFSDSQHPRTQEFLSRIL